jgi:CBS domain-containing protein
MLIVKDILDQKGSAVHCISPSSSVLEAARLMNRHKIGCLVATDGERVAGIFTERDVLQRVVVERRDPALTTVGQVMSSSVVCCRPETPIDEARGVFKNRRFRHLPVVDAQERLRGLISIGDVNALQAVAQEQTIHLLHEYIYGRT